MSTEEQKRVIADLMYEISQLKRDHACHQAKLAQLMQLLHEVSTAVDKQTLYNLDDTTGEFLVRVAPGVNEIRPMAYPSAQDIWIAVHAMRQLAEQIEEKEQALARCQERQL